MSALIDQANATRAKDDDEVAGSTGTEEDADSE
jgi:hypothetical protein